MNLRLFLTTFVTIFVAEIGDKTQLATLGLTSAGGSKWAVFGGAALALVSTTALAVGGGELLGRVISPLWMQRIAGTLFIVLGILALVFPPSSVK